MTGSKREQRRLAAAEEVCRAFRKAMSHAGTQPHYISIALDWLMVWIENAPKAVWGSPPTPCKRRRARAGEQR